jgi:acyl-CoA thioester hydrolase
VDETILADYPSRISIPIQWGDMDAFNHVNNVIHIRWLESSRIDYLEEAGMRDLMTSHKVGPILAAIHCDYKRQLAYPGSVRIGARIARLGRSSMTVAHRIVDEQSGELAAEGESVVVVYDFANQRPVRIPVDVREAVASYQGVV